MQRCKNFIVTMVRNYIKLSSHPLQPCYEIKFTVCCNSKGVFFISKRKFLKLGKLYYISIVWGGGGVVVFPNLAYVLNSAFKRVCYYHIILSCTYQCVHFYFAKKCFFFRFREREFIFAKSNYDLEI